MNAMHWIGLYIVFMIGLAHSLTYYLFETGEEEQPIWLFLLTRYSAYAIAFIPFLYLAIRKNDYKQEPFT
jgi:hypothetical protein